MNPRTLASAVTGAILPGIAWAAPQCGVTTIPFNDPQNLDCFGCAATLWGDTIVVGDLNHDFPQGYDQAGSAYVYERTPGGWVETAELRGNDPAYVKFFGNDLALWGDTLLVGAMHHSALIGAYSNAGAVYVFERVGSAWTQTQRIFASDPYVGARFGKAVAMDESTAIVGADYHGVALSGAAYIFERTGTTWHETQKIAASPGQQFGADVALSNGTLVVGAVEVGVGPGFVSVLEHSGAAWVEVARLTASDGVLDGEFGRSVCISGDTIVVSARRYASASTGAVYVYDRVGGAWFESQKLTGALASTFGRGVTLFEDTLLVRSWESPSAFLYVYERVAGMWLEVERISLPSGPARPLDLEHDRALVQGMSEVFFLEFGPRTGTSTCEANVNSTGERAELIARGNADIDRNCLELTATSVPSGVFGYFLLSDSHTFLPLFGGSLGDLCVGLPLVRFAQDILTSGAGNSMTFTPDLTALPQPTVFTPGDTWTFQLWYRDGASSNTTNGLALTFATGGPPTVQVPRTLESIVETTTQFPVRVTLSQPTHEDVLVPWTVSGSATADSDFRIESANPLVIPGGATRTELLVTVADDIAQEPDETVTITLGVATGASSGTLTQYTLTIVDDD